MDSYQTKSMSGVDFIAAWTSRNQTKNNAAIMPIELTNSTGTCLEDLNDDCLLEIFSCNSLTWIDLCSLAEMCTRFKQITQRVFPKDYGIVCEALCNFISKNETEVMSLQNVERILKHFGLHLSELSISGEYSDGIKSIGKYCDEVTLKSLQISGGKSLDDITEHLHSICQRTQKLTLNGCDFTMANSCFVLNCSSLIELNIDCSLVCNEILKCNFPNLERFTWRLSYMFARVYDIRTLRNCDDLHKFIKRHGHQLKSINIPDCCDVILNVINNNCKELEELIIRGEFYRRFSNPASFTKLKILDFGHIYVYNLCHCVSLLKAVKSLEILKISFYHDVVPLQIFDVLSQLENLRELHLRDSKLNGLPWAMLPQLRKVNLEFSTSWCYITGITSMIEQLINLEELELHFPCNSQILSERDFSKICKIVERREHVLTLKCNLSLELKENCDDNQRVKLINV